MQKKSRSKLMYCILCMMLIVAMALSTVGCNKTDEKETPQGGQANVTQGADDTQGDASGGDAASGVTELGEGKVQFNFSVVDKNGNEAKFLIHTDKETVGEALLELGLIAGDEGDFGIYVKEVNGITADFDKDGTYWAFYINGEYAMTGADKTTVTEGDSYSFKVEK